MTQARARITELGGIDAICLSHPHFYAAHVDSRTPSTPGSSSRGPTRSGSSGPRRGSSCSTTTPSRSPAITVARIGGHFDGAAVLHWPAGSGGRGALLTGDTITVVPDRDWVSFMWSYPNLIPLDEATVLEIASRAERFSFDRIYGGWWGRVVVADGAAAVRRSADRYVARLHGARP